LRDRLDARTRATMIDAYRAGATAASIAAVHGLSARSVKRLVADAGVAAHRFKPQRAGARPLPGGDSWKGGQIRADGSEVGIA
jgi:hypothetical protein